MGHLFNIQNGDTGWIPTLSQKSVSKLVFYSFNKYLSITNRTT